MSTTPSLPPTFDEWFAGKNNGFTFDELHMAEGMLIPNAMRALAVEIRKYVSHVARKEPAA